MRIEGRIIVRLPNPVFPGVELGATFLVVHRGRVFLFSAFRLNLSNMLIHTRFRDSTSL